MNQLTTLVNNTSQTMSSLDFLDGIINPARIQAGETPHEPRKFLAKVEDELDLDVTGKKFRLNNNQTKTFYYDLTLDQLMLVGMRESKSVRRSVLEKLKQLEAPKIPQTLPEALRLAADLAEQKQIVEQQLAIAAPKAEFVDRYVQATGLLGFRETSKLLKVKENFFRDFLISKRIMYKLAGKLTPYSEHLEAGRFDVKTGENQVNGHAYTQVKFTPKGIQWIAGLLAMEQLEAA
ncbi:TPA: phage antirepressor KilAC domain-containing protein [Providencia rettgeri]|uniref:phage antirepressor KilAC domain-containing protein n=1 Tax=Providencia sp. PROV206 TaxID=2949904 RepID=UPI00234AF1A0|nr:phage antirepressor KilAC domain-containing protein [Providencia sp. PROV206]HEM7134774.1 phage antirepressor KilAC domain-containing protein [Providencia rettgeri]